MLLVTLPLDANSRPAPFVAVSGSELTFTFTRLRQTIGLTSVVEESTGFYWTPINTPLDVISQTNETETVRATVPLNEETKMFLRLRAAH